jgi:hypothetical protein
LIVSGIVLDRLKDLKMAYPKTTGKRRRELKLIAKQHFDETKLFVGVTCGKETKEVFDSYGKLAVDRVMAINKRSVDAYQKYFPELMVKHLAVRAAVRNELGVEPI